MPPMPMIGVETACRTWYTARKAMGLMAGPLSPPTTFPSMGLRRRQSTAIPEQVLMSEMASAPPAEAARAICAMSVTLGVSLAMTGSEHGLRGRRSPIARTCRRRCRSRRRR